MNLSKFIEYVKIHATWKNKPDPSTPVDAAALMKIESGIKSNNESIQELAAAVVSQIVNDPNKIASMAALYNVNQAVTKLNSDLSNSVKFEYKSITDSGKIWNCYVITLGGIRIVSAKTWLSGISCPTQWGGMYSSAEIAGLPYPITFNASPVVNATFNSISNHGFVMSISDGATTKSPAFKLLRGTSGTISGTLCVTAIGDIAS